MDDVAKAFLEIVEKESCNGAVVTLTSKEGAIYRYEDEDTYKQ